VATAVAVLNNFGTDSWNAEFHENLSTAARLSILVKTVTSHSQSVKMSYLLWKINGRTAKFFQTIDDIVAGKIASAQENNVEPITDEKIKKAIADLMEIGTSLSGIYEEARRKRLLNNSLIAGPVTALRANADQFFELAEWCDLILNGDRVEEIFANANEQRNKGDVYDLTQV
jgi:hypothetical protein